MQDFSETSLFGIRVILMVLCNAAYTTYDPISVRNSILGIYHESQAIYVRIIMVTLSDKICMHGCACMLKFLKCRPVQLRL